MKKSSMVLILTLAVIISVSGVKAYAFNTDKEQLDSIKKVLINASTIADKTYIDCKQSLKKGTLNENKSDILQRYKDELTNNMSDEYANKVKEVWITNQATNAQNGPDCIDCGISNIEIKDFDIDGKTATVTAVLIIYLVDRVNIDGKPYFDKMEGKIIDTAKLTNDNGNWKIVEFSSIPDLDSTVHTLTEAL